MQFAREVVKIPNWCDGDLVVLGKHKDMLEFKEFAHTKKRELKEKNLFKQKEQKNENTEILNVLEDNYVYEENDLDTEQFIPMPKKSDDEDFNSYDWCCKNWGTKWGICNPDLWEETKRRLAYRFQTAWSPCYPVILAMSKKFPNLKFIYKYYEMGVGYKGKYIVKGEEVVENDCDNEYKGRRGG